MGLDWPVGPVEHGTSATLFLTVKLPYSQICVKWVRPKKRRLQHGIPPLIY